MSRAAALGVVRGAYPERWDERPSSLDELGLRAVAPLARRLREGAGYDPRLPERVEPHANSFATLGDQALDRERRTIADALRADGFGKTIVARSFALVREMARRRLGMAHFDCQLVGGYAMLRGCVAEMATGEGKTITAVLPAATAALAGVPTHVVTVNGYLAERDARSLRPLYEGLGLSVGLILSGMDTAARRAAYACDVTYCTNKEVAFDYLKDRIVLGGHPTRQRLRIEALGARESRLSRLVHRGLCFAIVDEADSVLIDEARTPLIISDRRSNEGEEHVYRTSVEIARQLERGDHFAVDEPERRIALTDAGRARVADLGAARGGLWRNRSRREAVVEQALAALHLFRRDQHYLVRGDEVQIVDEYTGRIMQGRSWEHGLHQMIEVKEGASPTGRQDPLARISYQRFFRRYRRLAGMTGTAREVAPELWGAYRLPVVTIPTHRACMREGLGERIHASAEAKWADCVARIAALHADGRPVLVGTRSVEASELLSARLDAIGVPHRVLNARQDTAEAEIVAEAGQPGRITVATNMAGRGTDIRLGEGVAARGGLHVLATERHDARRIDRQLFGRCARQGDPGSCETIASLEDELCRVHGGAAVGLLRRAGEDAVRRFGPLALANAQRRAGRMHRRMRRDLVELDRQLDQMLAFSGRPD